LLLHISQSLLEQLSFILPALAEIHWGFPDIPGGVVTPYDIRDFLQIPSLYIRGYRFSCILSA
jgi:hypothetical protein